MHFNINGHGNYRPILGEFFIMTVFEMWKWNILEKLV